MFALSSCRLSAFHLARLYSFICPCSSVRLYPPAAFRANRLLSRRSPPSPSCVHAEAARRARWETAAAVRADRTLERHAPSSTLCSRPDPLRCPPRADDDVFFAKYATHPSTLRLGWSLSESMRYPMLSFFTLDPCSAPPRAGRASAPPRFYPRAGVKWCTDVWPIIRQSASLRTRDKATYAAAGIRPRREISSMSTCSGLAIFTPGAEKPPRRS